MSPPIPLAHPARPRAATGPCRSERWPERLRIRRSDDSVLEFRQVLGSNLADVRIFVRQRSFQQSDRHDTANIGEGVDNVFAYVRIVTLQGNRQCVRGGVPGYVCELVNGGGTDLWIGIE